jgi:hypothetical protein
VVAAFGVAFGTPEGMPSACGNFWIGEYGGGNAPTNTNADSFASLRNDKQKGRRPQLQKTIATARAKTKYRDLSTALFTKSVNSFGRDDVFLS